MNNLKLMAIKTWGLKVMKKSVTKSKYSISDQSEAEYSSNNESTIVSSPSKAAFMVIFDSSFE